MADIDQWSEVPTLDNQMEDIHYPPNWLRFDETAEIPTAHKTGKLRIPKPATNSHYEIEIDNEMPSHVYTNQEHVEPRYAEEIHHDPLSVPAKSKTLPKKIMHRIEHHYSCLPELRKRPTLPRRNSIIAKEVDKGVYSLVDRGIIKAGEDVTSLVQLGSRSVKLPNLRFTQARIHDVTTKNDKISGAFSKGDHDSTGIKLAVEPLVRYMSMLFPPLDGVVPETDEKSLPPNPRSTPTQSRVAKNRNLWNLHQNSHRRAYILGRDTPSDQVLVGWVIPFKGGVVFRHAPGYQEFHKRFKNTNLYLCIDWIIQNIENLLQSFGIQYADVFCEKIIALAQQPLIWPLQKDDLIMCIANPDEVLEKMKDPALKFKNTLYSREMAATLIQRAVRTYRKRNEHLRLLEIVWATKIFQKFWKIKKTGRSLRAALKDRLVNESTKGCVRLINNLKRDWIQIFEASEQRVIVQVCNWTRPERAPDLPNFDFSRYPYELNIRCFPLNDPKVSMVFICPFSDPLRQQALLKLFDLAHRENNPIRLGRVLFVVPETISIFQQNTSMATVTCMSPRIIKEIKRLCEGKDTLLYSDSVSEWDIGLSATLQIPIFGCAPDLFELMSTKSKARKFLEGAGIKVSSALLSTATDTTALLANFIKGTYTFTKARYFIFIPSFKLNLDYPSGQLPVAYIGDANLESFAKSFAVKQAQTSNKKSAPKKEKFQMVDTAIQELEKVLKFVNPGFKDLQSFIQSWKNSKGFIHAVPCDDPRKLRIIEFGFTIDVNGNLELIVSTETIFDKAFGTCGFFVPQEQLSIEESGALLKKVADYCQLLGMMGRFTLEVWKWENADGEKEYFANNLKAYFSTTILRGQTVVLASGCKFSASTDKMIYERSNLYVETKPLHKAKFFNMDAAMVKFNQTVLAGIEPLENRVAFYQDRIIHNAVGFIGRKTANSFFESHGITFDYWSRTGSILPSDEGLTKSSIPIITIQKDRYLCLEKFLGTLDTIYSILFSKKNEQYHTFQTVTERVLYEFLWEKSQKFDSSKTKSPETSIFQSDIKILDSLEIREISKLISTYVAISLNRLSSPSDDDSIPRYQISRETVKLLTEGIPSNIEAEFDPTFHKPIFLPPYKRSIKKEASFKESSESISFYKRNSLDNGSNSSVNTESSKKQPIMPTLKEDNPDP